MNKVFTIEKCSQDNIQSIVDGINDYNFNIVPATADLWTPLEFSVSDNNGNTIGGVLGGIGCWNGLEIKVLWVSEANRKSGIGSALLQHIENIAKEKGAHISMLDTFDFQSPDFYLKNGYTVIGKIDDFPPGQTRIYFSKTLNL